MVEYRKVELVNNVADWTKGRIIALYDTSISYDWLPPIPNEFEVEWVTLTPDKNTRNYWRTDRHLLATCRNLTEVVTSGAWSQLSMQWLGRRAKVKDITEITEYMSM